MKCPKCLSEDSIVIDSRAARGSTIRRRRKCEACLHRFTTYESYTPPQPPGAVASAAAAVAQVRMLRDLCDGLLASMAPPEQVEESPAATVKPVEAA